MIQDILASSVNARCQSMASISWPNPVQDCGCHALKWLKGTIARIDREQTDNMHFAV